MAKGAPAFSPYGHRDHETILAYPLGFNGERYDPLTRTYSLGQGYRSYSNLLMRFLAPDNLSPFGQGGMNAYGYCSGDPVNNLDPTGHMGTKQHLMLANGRFYRHDGNTGRQVAVRPLGGHLARQAATFEQLAEPPTAPRHAGADYVPVAVTIGKTTLIVKPEQEIDTRKMLINNLVITGFNTHLRRNGIRPDQLAPWALGQFKRVVDEQQTLITRLRAGSSTQGS
jgi:RHS repeat-associated protein